MIGWLWMDCRSNKSPDEVQKLYEMMITYHNKSKSSLFTRVENVQEFKSQLNESLKKVRANNLPFIYSKATLEQQLSESDIHYLMGLGFIHRFYKKDDIGKFSKEEYNYCVDMQKV